MTYPRCALPGLLLYVSYITSYGQWQCVLSSSNLPANYNVKDALRVPGSMSSTKPWFETYTTNPNRVYSTTESGQAVPTSRKTWLSPQDARIALKRTTGNYLYPDIPGPLHRTPIHACLAGYDGEIYSIINEIRETTGNEIEIHFYLFQSCKFHLIESHLTTVKAIQDILSKYHHYICLNKKYVESYSEKDHCWYIEKLIMLPSLKTEFESLPKHITAEDFNRISDNSNPFTLEIDEKIDPDHVEYIQKIREYENKYEVKLDDIASGKRKLYKNNIIYTDNADVKYDTRYSQRYSSYSTASYFKQNVYSSNIINLPGQMQQIPYSTTANLPAKEISDFRQKYDTKFSNLPPRLVTSAYTAPYYTQPFKSIPGYSSKTYATSQKANVVQASEYKSDSFSKGSSVAYATSQNFNQQSYNKVSIYTPTNVSPAWPVNIITSNKKRKEVLNSIPWDIFPPETKNKDVNVKYVTPSTKLEQIIPFAPSKENYDFVESYTPQQKVVMPKYDTVALQQKPVVYDVISDYRPPQPDKGYTVYYANKRNEGAKGQYIPSGQNARLSWPQNLVTYLPKQTTQGKLPDYYQGPFSPTSQGNFNNLQMQQAKWPFYTTVAPLYQGQDNVKEVPSYDTIWARPTLSTERSQTWPRKIGVQLANIETIGYGKPVGMNKKYATKTISKPNYDVISSYTPRDNVAISGVNSADSIPRNVLSTSINLPVKSKPEYITVNQQPDFKVKTSSTNSDISAVPKVLTNISVVRPIQHLRTIAIAKPQKVVIPQAYTSPYLSYQNKNEYQQRGYTGQTTSTSPMLSNIAQPTQIEDSQPWPESPKIVTQNYVSIPYTQPAFGKYAIPSSNLLDSQRLSKALPYYPYQTNKSPEFVTQDSLSGFNTIPSYTQRTSEIGSRTPSVYSQWPGGIPVSYGPAYSLRANQIKPDTVTVVPWNQKPKSRIENFTYIPSYMQQPIAAPKYDSILSYSQALKPDLSSVVQPYIEPSKGTSVNLATISTYTQQPSTVQLDSNAPSYQQPKTTPQNYVSIPTYTPSPVKVVPTIATAVPRYQKPQDFVSIPSYTKQPTYSEQPAIFGPYATSQQPLTKHLVSIPKYSQWPLSILKKGASTPSYTTCPVDTQTLTSIPSYTQLPLKGRQVAATVLPSNQWPKRITNEYVSIPYYSQIPPSISSKIQTYTTLPIDTGFGSAPFLTGQVPKPEFVSIQPCLERPKNNLQGFTVDPSYTQRPLTMSGTEPNLASSGLQSRPTYGSLPMHAISKNSQISSKQDYVQVLAHYPIKRIKPLRTHAISSPQKGPPPQPYRSTYSPYQNTIYNKIVDYQPIGIAQEPTGTSSDNKLRTQRPTGVKNDYVSKPSYTTYIPTVTGSSTSTQEPIEIKPNYVEVPTYTQKPSNVSPGAYSKSLSYIQPSYTPQLPKWPYVQQGKSIPQDFISIPSYTQKPMDITTAYEPPFMRESVKKPIISIPSYSQKLAPNFIFVQPTKRPSMWPKGVSEDSQQIIPLSATRNLVSVVPEGTQDYATIPCAFPNQIDTQSGIKSKTNYNIRPTGTSLDYVQLSSYCTPSELKERPKFKILQPCTKQPQIKTQNFVTPSTYTQLPLSSRTDSVAAPYTQGPTGLPSGYDTIPSYTKPDRPSEYVTIPSYTQAPVGKPSVTPGYDVISSNIPPGSSPSDFKKVPLEFKTIPSYTRPYVRPIGSVEYYSPVPGDKSLLKPLEYVSIPCYTQGSSDKPSAFDPSHTQRASDTESRTSDEMGIPPGYDVIPSYTQPSSVPTSYAPPVDRLIGSAGVPQGYNAIPSYSQILEGRPLSRKDESTKYNSIPRYTQEPSGFDPSYSVEPITSPLAYTQRPCSKTSYDTILSYTRPESTPLISTRLPLGYESIPSYSKPRSWPVPSGYAISSFTPPCRKSLKPVEVAPAYSSIPTYTKPGNIPSGSIGVPQGYDVVSSYSPRGGKPIGSKGVSSGYETILIYMQPGVKPTNSVAIPSDDFIPAYTPLWSRPRASIVPQGYNVIPTYTQPGNIPLETANVSYYSPTSAKPIYPTVVSPVYETVPSYTRPSITPSRAIATPYISPGSKPIGTISSYSQPCKLSRSTEVPAEFQSAIPTYSSPSGYSSTSFVSVSGKPVVPITVIPGSDAISSYIQPDIRAPWSKVPSGSKVHPSYTQPVEITPRYDTIPSYSQIVGSPSGPAIDLSRYTAIPTSSSLPSRTLGPVGGTARYDAVPSYSPRSGKTLRPIEVFYSQPCSKVPWSKRVSPKYNTIPSYTEPCTRPSGSEGDPSRYNTVPTYTPSSGRPSEYSPRGVGPLDLAKVRPRYDTILSYGPSDPKGSGPGHISTPYYTGPGIKTTEISPEYHTISSSFPQPCKTVPWTRGVAPVYTTIPTYSQPGNSPFQSTRVSPGYNMIPSYSSSSDASPKYDTIISHNQPDNRPSKVDGIPLRYDTIPFYSSKDGRPFAAVVVPPVFNTILTYTPQNGRPSEYDPSYSQSPEGKPAFDTIPSYTSPERTPSEVSPGYKVIPSYTPSSAKTIEPIGAFPEYDAIISHNQPCKKPAGSAYTVVPTYSSPFVKSIGAIGVSPEYKAIPSYSPIFVRPLSRIVNPLVFNKIPCYTEPAKSTKYTMIPSYSPTSSRSTEQVPSYIQRPSGTPSYNIIPSYSSLGSVPSKSGGVSLGTIPCYSFPGSRPIESATILPEHNMIPSFSPKPKSFSVRRPSEFSAIPPKYDTISSYTPLGGKPLGPVDIKPAGSLEVPLGYDSLHSYSGGKPLEPICASSRYKSIPSFIQPGNRPTEYASTPKVYARIPTYIGPVSRPFQALSGYNTVPGYSSASGRPVGPIGVRPVNIPSYSRAFTSPIGTAVPSVYYNPIPCYSQVPQGGRLGPDGTPLVYDSITSYTPGPDRPLGYDPSYSKGPGGKPSYETIPCYTSPSSRPSGVTPGFETITSYTEPGKRPIEGRPIFESIPSYISPANKPIEILPGPVTIDYDKIPCYTTLNSSPVGVPSGYDPIYSYNRPKSREAGVSSKYNAIPSYTSIPLGYNVIPSYTSQIVRPLGPIKIPPGYDTIPLYTKPGNRPSESTGVFPGYNVIPSYRQRLGGRPSFYNIPSYTSQGSRWTESVTIPCLSKRLGVNSVSSNEKSLQYDSILSNIPGPVGRPSGKPSYETISSYTSPSSKPSGVTPDVSSYTGPGSKLAEVSSDVGPIDYHPCYTQRPDGKSSYDAIPSYIRPSIKPSRVPLSYNAIPSYSPRSVGPLDLTRVPPGYDAIISYGPSGEIGSRPGEQSRPKGIPLGTIPSYRGPGRSLVLPLNYDVISSYTRPCSRPIKSAAIPLKYDVLPSYSQKLGGMPSILQRAPSQYQSIPCYAQKPTPSSSGYSKMKIYTQAPSSIPIGTQAYNYIPSYTQRPIPTGFGKTPLGSISSLSQGPTPLGYETIPAYTKEPILSGTAYKPMPTYTQGPNSRPIGSQTIPLGYNFIPSYTQRPKPSEHNAIPTYTQGTTPSGSNYSPIAPCTQGGKPIGSQGVPLEYVSIPSYTQPSPSGFKRTPSESIPSYTPISFEKDPSVSIPYYTRRPTRLKYNTIPSYTQKSTSSGSYSPIVSYTQGSDDRTIGSRGPLWYDPSSFGRVPSGSIPSYTQGITPTKFESISTYTPTDFEKSPSSLVSSYSQESIPAEYYTIPSYTHKPTPSGSGYSPIPICTQGTESKPIGSQRAPLGYYYIPSYTQGPKTSGFGRIASSFQRPTSSEYYSIPPYTPRPLSSGFGPLGSIPSYTQAQYTSIPYTKGLYGRPPGFGTNPTGYYYIPSYTQRSTPPGSGYSPISSYNHDQGARPSPSEDVPLGYDVLPYYSELPLRTLPGFRSVPSYTTNMPDTQIPLKTRQDFATTIPFYRLPKNFMPCKVRIPYVSQKLQKANNLYDTLKSLKSKPYLQTPEELKGLYDTLSSIDKLQGQSKNPLKDICTGQPSMPYSSTSVPSIITEVPYSTLKQSYSQGTAPTMESSGQYGQPYSKPCFNSQPENMPRYSGIPAYTYRPTSESLTKYKPIVQYTKPSVPYAPSEQPCIALRQPCLPCASYSKLGQPCVPWTSYGKPCTIPGQPWATYGKPYTFITQPCKQWAPHVKPYMISGTGQPGVPWASYGKPYTKSGQPCAFWAPYLKRGEPCLPWAPYVPVIKPRLPLGWTYKPIKQSLIATPHWASQSTSFTPSGQPCVPYTTSGQPCVPYTTLGQPCLPYKIPGQPYVSYTSQGQPCGPYQNSEKPWTSYTTSGQPCVPYITSRQPCVPYRTSGQPNELWLKSSVPSKPFPYVPLRWTTTPSKIPYMPRSSYGKPIHRLGKPCIPLTGKPVDPWATYGKPLTVSERPSTFYAPWTTYGKLVTPTGQPSITGVPCVPYASGKPCMPLSTRSEPLTASEQSSGPYATTGIPCILIEQPCLPWPTYGKPLSTSGQPCASMSPLKLPYTLLGNFNVARPTNIKPFMTSAQPSITFGQPCIPCTSSGKPSITSGQPCIPCVSSGQPSVITGKPCVPYTTSGQPCVSFTTSEQPCVPCTTSGQPCVPCTTSEQPCVPCTTSGQPCMPCNTPGQPCVPYTTSGQPCVPYTTSGQPCVPCTTSGQPCVPCTTSGQPCVPCTISGQPCVPYTTSGQPCVPCTTSGKPCVPCTTSGQPCVPCTPSGQPCVPCTTSGQPCVPCTTSGQPCVPCTTSGQPRVSYTRSWQPCVPCTMSGQPCVPCTTSGQPCVPFTSSGQPCNPCAMSRQPCVPCTTSGQPCVPCTTSGQPCVPYTRSWQPCVPCTTSGQPRVPYTRPWQPCVPCTTSGQPCAPCTTSGQPCVPYTRSGQPCVPSSRSWQPCVPCTPSGQPCVPCTTSGQPCVPCTTSGQPCVPCTTSGQPRVSYTRSWQPCVPCTMSGQPCVPCTTSGQPCVPFTSSGQPCNPCAMSRQPCVPCTTSGQPCVPCTTSGQPCVPYTRSWQPCVPCTTSGQPRVPYTRPWQPCVPCTTSGQPCAPCTTSGQPCAPCTTSGQPCMPFTSSGQPCNPCAMSRQPCVPCTTSGQPWVTSMTSKHPCIPCVSSKHPCVPSRWPYIPGNIPSSSYLVNTPSLSATNDGQYVSPTQTYNTAQPHKQRSSQSPIVIYQQPTNKPNGYNIDKDEFCKALQDNNMTNINNIDMQALIDRVKYCMANSLLKTNVSDKNLKDQCVPLGDIIVANTNFEKQNPFFSKTVDGLKVKGYMNKVKVLKAKIVYEADEVDIPNFVPVVKCGDTRDPKQIQNLVANIVKNVYKEEPVLLKGPGPTDQDHLIMKNLDLDGDKAFVWPAVCESNVEYSHRGTCPICRQYCQCCQ